MKKEASLSEDILNEAKRVFDIEIEGLREVSNALNDNFTAAAELILQAKGRLVVCGMGKSGLVGRKMAATFASTGTPSFFLHPGEAFHGDLGMVTPQDVFLGISYSGETEELIRLIPYIRANQNKLIALCGKVDSTLARNADAFLNAGVSREACPLELAPTSSTTAALALGDALAVALMKMRDFKAENFARFHPGGSLGRRLLTRVKDVMHKDNLPFIDKEAGLQELIYTMTSGKMGLAIVSNNKQHILGIVTDGDLRRTFENINFEEAARLKVENIMTPKPKIISADTMLTDAEPLMTENKITALLVADSEQKAIGVLQIYQVR